MRVLDLFCGAGGAAWGYSLAGATEIVGVDRAPQPRYPFTFVQADALDYLAELLRDSGPLPFDAIHASPPCQRFSTLRHATASKGEDHADLIAPTRALLRQAGLPYVIENVPGAPLNFSIELCGSMFGLGALSGDGVRTKRQWRQLRRHRRFELSFPMLQPGCQHQGEAIGVYGHGGAIARKDANGRPFARRGGFQGTANEARQAMQAPWMLRQELSQAVPPAYTHYIGTALLPAQARRRPERRAGVAPEF